MTPRYLEACASFQAAQKACWDILLRELPDAESFPPGVLDAAMEGTLTQLWDMLRRESAEERLNLVRSLPAPLPPGRQCGLRTHLPYFNTGLRALELIAGELERANPDFGGIGVDSREELAAAFDLLVQCQLETICAQCAQAGECQISDRRALAKSFAGDRAVARGEPKRRKRPARRKTPRRPSR